MSVLKEDFFKRPTLEVAPDLLGAYLVRNGERYRITDVEAYDGPEDKACHASKGRTARTEVMFGPAGIWYVYFVYGMHHILNIITGDVGYPAGILFRGLEGISGPGRITKHLHITKDLYGKRAVKRSGLWIEEGIKPNTITALPRVGVEYAEEWAQKPYRFVSK